MSRNPLSIKTIAATAVNILSDADVGEDRQVFIDGIIPKVNGATAWTDATATKVSVKDTASSPVEAIAVAKAGLTGNAILAITTANITLDSTIITGAGLTKGKGLNVVADAVFGAGSDIYITVYGVLK